MAASAAFGNSAGGSVNASAASLSAQAAAAGRLHEEADDKMRVFVASEFFEKQPRQREQERTRLGSRPPQLQRSGADANSGSEQ